MTKRQGKSGASKRVRKAEREPALENKEPKKPKAPKSVMVGLVAIREQHGMSLQDVSTALGKRGGGRFECGTDKAVVSRLEKGQTSPGFDHMQAYAEVFGVPVGPFFVSTHIMARLRDGKHDKLDQYLKGLLALICVARKLKEEGKLDNEQGQKVALQKLFDAWLEHGFDARALPKQPLGAE